MMAEIPLVNQLGILLVDEDDLPLISPHKWFLWDSHGSPYAVTGQVYRGDRITAHQLLLRPPAGMQVDHINGDGLDCRRANLRLATNQQNQWNRKANTKSTSQYIGVSWQVSRSRWIAQIKVEGRNLNLGRFTSEEDAARARDVVALKYFGEFARLNFPR